MGKKHPGASGAVVLLLAVVLNTVALESAPFIRGDANTSSKVDISDGIHILGYLFLGSPTALDCEEAADIDANGTINIGDAVFLLGYLFNGGIAPEPPFPNCGTGPAAGGLTCAFSPGCEQPTLTAFELIDRALAAGEISSETALIYRVFHVYEDDRLPVAFRGSASPTLDTQLVADVLAVYGELSEAGREALDPFLVPPSASGSWLDQREIAAGGGDGVGAGGAVEWQTILSPSGKVKVWSQTRYPGDDARAAEIAGAVDGIWDTLAGLMGREPVSDGEVPAPNGGDAKFDIYLVRIKSAGVTFVYSAGFSCSSPTPVYMLVDDRETECLLPTVAHELMHALQWTYAGSPRCPTFPSFRWWMEASATWAEDYVFRKDKNQCQDPTLLLSHPELPLDDSGSPYNSHDPHPYAAYLWPYFLDAATGSAAYVRTIWENFPTHTTALEAINASVPDGLQKWWPLFAVYNWNDHPQFNYRFDNLFMSASRADPATGEPRPEGETFTAVELNGQQELHIPLFAKVQHPGRAAVELREPPDEHHARAVQRDVRRAAAEHRAP